MQMQKCDRARWAHALALLYLKCPQPNYERLTNAQNMADLIHETVSRARPAITLYSTSTSSRVKATLLARCQAARARQSMIMGERPRAAREGRELPPPPRSLTPMHLSRCGASLHPPVPPSSPPQHHHRNWAATCDGGVIYLLYNLLLRHHHKHYGAGRAGVQGTCTIRACRRKRGGLRGGAHRDAARRFPQLVQVMTVEAVAGMDCPNTSF